MYPFLFDISFIYNIIFRWIFEIISNYSKRYFRGYTYFCCYLCTFWFSYPMKLIAFSLVSYLHLSRMLSISLFTKTREATNNNVYSNNKYIILLYSYYLKNFWIPFMKKAPRHCNYQIIDMELSLLDKYFSSI